MPSTTRGSILISTANDIGTTLVDKLGGTGYTPDEWDSAANLCGIASADIETALENITESTPQGAERGSMSIAKANSIGRILNKKFDTSRGFKPSEWASAISKLTPLEIKTASGAIASFSDGADDVPVKSCVVSFTPSGGGGTPSSPVAITGVSNLNVSRWGKNLLSITPYYRKGTNNPDFSSCMFVKAGTYMFSFDKITDGETEATNWRFVVTVYNTDGTINSGLTFSGLAYNSSLQSYLNGSNISVKTRVLTFPSDSYIFIGFAYGSSTESMSMTQPMLEVGSTATTYSAYVTPSVVTDTFGQTIYGGSRDLVTDKASVTQGIITFDGSNDENWCLYSNFNGFYINISDMKSGTRQDGVCNMLTKSTSTAQGQTNAFWLGAGNTRIYIIGVYDSIGSTVEALRTFLSNTNMVITYPLATPTELTGLTPHSINTLLGDNNFYADTGDTTVEYRADIDLALNA